MATLNLYRRDGAGPPICMAWFVFFFTHYGVPAPKTGVVVDNRTAVAVNICVVMVGPKPILQAVVPPRSRLATVVACGRTEMREVLLEEARWWAIKPAKPDYIPYADRMATRSLWRGRMRHPGHS